MPTVKNIKILLYRFLEVIEKMSLASMIRSKLSNNVKNKLLRISPNWLYNLYERNMILRVFNLKDYFNSQTDSLHFGKTVLPMEVLCNKEAAGAFNNEYPDIIYPFISDKTSVTLVPYNEGPYELNDVKVNSGDAVFDCGAHFGLFSAMLANRGCICYAFEPFQKNVHFLNIIREKNSHITVVPYAVGDVDGRVQFEDSPSATTGSRVLYIGSEQNANKGFTTVESTTLDSFTHNNNLTRVDFIKADIEGAERYMLMGAKSVLKDFAPKLSICTYHLPDDPKVLRELILDANPNYVIEEKYKKMYAHVP